MQIKQTKNNFILSPTMHSDSYSISLGMDNSDNYSISLEPDALKISIPDISFKDSINYIANKYCFNTFNTFLTKVEMLVPNKVMRFTFSDGTQIKTICHDEDMFDLRYAFLLAFAKRYFKGLYTREGFEKYAHYMGLIKYWDRKAKEGIQLFKKQEKERTLKLKEEKERAAARKRQAEKKARKKRERKERQLAALAEKVKMM